MIRIRKEEGLTFDDVILVPRRSSFGSRFNGDIDFKVELLPGIFLDSPLISANMDSVTEELMATTLNQLGGLGIIHRFMSKEKQYAEISKSIGYKIGCVGVGEDGLERARFIGGICDGFLIDIAHGHSDVLILCAEKLIKEFGKPIIAGNVATAEGALDLVKTGIQCIKCGIGPGSLCTTRIKTGTGVPQLSAIDEIAIALNTWYEEESELAFKPTIIADGGIRSSGDIIKALAAGADAIMIGNLFAGTTESPGQVINVPNIGRVKTYRGMACYSDDTELLTENGWIKFIDMNENMKIATLTKESKLEYHKPTKIFQYNYNGNMIGINNNFIDLLITPNHNLFVAKKATISRGYKRKFHLVKAEDAFGQNWHFKRTSNKWVGDTKEYMEFEGIDEKHKHKLPQLSILMEKWLFFFGLWLAEGSTYEYLQKDKYKTLVADCSNYDKKLLKDASRLFEEDNIKVCFSNKSNSDKAYELRIYDLRICKYLQQFGHAPDKYVPNNIKNLPAEYLKILLNAIWLGDGCKSKNIIYTTSRQLRDDLIEIILKIGYAPGLHINREKGSEGCIGGKKFTRNHTVWAVSFSNKITEPYTFGCDHRMEEYNGIVYCVEVQNNVIFVKRNNKMVWCGNSREAQEDWKGEATSVEGEMTLVNYKGSVLDVFNDLISGMKSGMSYQNAHNVKELRESAVFIKQTSSGVTEAKPHALFKE